MYKLIILNMLISVIVHVDYTFIATPIFIIFCFHIQMNNNQINIFIYKFIEVVNNRVSCN